MNRGSRDLLWLWIIGISDYIVHSKMADLEINEEIAQCNDEVSKICFDQSRSQEPQIAEEKVDYKDKDLFKLVGGTLKTKNMEIGMIRVERELKVMLLRHWNLYDSISNSNYMVTKLNIHREPGQNTFKKFLARIGCPLEQAKQKYNFMDAQLRSELKQRILDHSAEFKLESILVSSFVRQINEVMQVSAMDVAYSLSTILEYPHHINQYHNDIAK